MKTDDMWNVCTCKINRNITCLWYHVKKVLSKNLNFFIGHSNSWVAIWFRLMIVGFHDMKWRIKLRHIGAKGNLDKKGAYLTPKTCMWEGNYCEACLSDNRVVWHCKFCGGVEQHVGGALEKAHMEDLVRWVTQTWALFPRALPN